MIIGYTRVSTDDQNLNAQIDALTAVGAEKILKDKLTGKSRSRPRLERVLDQLREGDVIVVTKYDRLARSLKDLIDLVETIRERKAGFRSLGEDIDTTTPAGRLVFHVFGSIAEFERERIVERTKEGLEAARKRGWVGGSRARNGTFSVSGTPLTTDEDIAWFNVLNDEEKRALIFAKIKATALP